MKMKKSFSTSEKARISNRVNKFYKHGHLGNSHFDYYILRLFFGHSYYFYLYFNSFYPKPLMSHGKFSKTKFNFEISRVVLT